MVYKHIAPLGLNDPPSRFLSFPLPNPATPSILSAPVGRDSHLDAKPSILENRPTRFCVLCVKFCFDWCGFADGFSRFTLPHAAPLGLKGILCIPPVYKHVAPLGLKALMHQNSRHGLHRRGGVPPPDGLGDPTPTDSTARFPREVTAHGVCLLLY